MKIVYCLPQVYKPGGIERIVSIKANYFAEMCNYEVYIITSCQKGLPPYYDFSGKIKFIDLDIDYDSILSYPLCKRIFYKLNYLRRHKKLLSTLLYKLKANIVVSTFTHEASFLPKIKDGSKKVLEFHFCKGHKRKMADAFGFSFLTRCIYYFRCWQEENIIVPKYDSFVVLTKEDQIQWLDRNPQTICIPNILPFDVDKVSLLTSKSVIAVGRLDAQKGFDRLIKVWLKVSKLYPDWTLHIYGEGPDRKKLLQLIAELDLEASVVIHPPTNRIMDCYLASSIFVMTSRYEGLPMTLLEATSLGLPAVCYDFQCGPKDVIVDKQNGFLIQEDDEEAMISCMDMLMKDECLREEMGKEAKLLSVRYSVDSIMPKWINLFNDLCFNDKNGK